MPKNKRNKKQSKGKLRPSDLWATPCEAVTPEFISRLPKQDFYYGEPCVGDGALAIHLQELVCHATLCYYGDIRETPFVYSQLKDAALLKKTDMRGMPLGIPDVFITNPPWHRQHLFPILDNLLTIAPVWALLPAAILHKRQFSPYLRNCSDIVSVGPVNFIPGNKGYMDVVWCLLKDMPQTTIFHARNPESVDGRAPYRPRAPRKKGRKIRYRVRV